MPIAELRGGQDLVGAFPSGERETFDEEVLRVLYFCPSLAWVTTRVAWAEVSASRDTRTGQNLVFVGPKFGFVGGDPAEAHFFRALKPRHGQMCRMWVI